MFTGDIFAGIAIAFSGADLRDQWTFTSFSPGASPTGPSTTVPCSALIAAPGDPNNGTGLVELISDCTADGSWVPVEPFAGACPCDGGIAVGPSLKGMPAAAFRGQWSLFVDFTSGAGVTTLGVASDTMNLIYTPAVIVTHGWAATCDDVTTLENLIRQELAVVSTQVDCAGYDYREGVASAAAEFGVQYVRFRSKFPTADPIEIVAHSMGGLVARYWYQFLYDQADDGTVGSISVLGTPNNGVNVAKLQRLFCPTHAKILGVVPVGGWVCGFGNWVSDELDKHTELPDFDSASVRDLKPNSGLLKQLNRGFVLPDAPVFRAHAGRLPLGSFPSYNPAALGWSTSGSFDNDCFISEHSVDGPSGVFNTTYPRFEYQDDSHDILRIPNFCHEPTLVDDQALVDNMLPDLKGETAVLSPAVRAAPAAQEPPTPEMQTLTSVTNLVNQSAQNTEDLTVPAGLAEADFTVSWLYDTVPPDLSFTLVRPDGTTVAATDGDVAGSLDIGGTGAFYVLSKGFEMNNPAAGTWHVIVGGTTVPNPPQPYIVSLATDSAVALNLDIASDPIQAGTSQTITAELDDNGTAVAPTTIAASVLVLDGSAEPVALHDDGLDGDAVAGDHVFTGNIDTTGGCGTYRVQVTASGSTSEGNVTREQLDTYDVSVPGDAVRDPCNPDEDGDGISDADELNIYHTDPLNPDTDGDGLSDGAEINTYHTNPLVADTDGDGLTDGAEVNTYHTNPLVADTDGDGLTDGAEVNTYGTNPLIADTDGDGLTDGAEVNTYHTDPLNADTDGDGCGDGKELQLSPPINPNDPWDFYSVPVPALYVSPDPTHDVRDHVVAAADSQTVFGYFKKGAVSGTTVYDQDLNGNGIEDGVEYDRTILGVAISGPPDGVIAASDAQLAFAQFNHGYAC